MLGSLGVPEIIFIVVIALLIFGPRRLPELGRTVGKGLAEFRRASNEVKRTINAELALEEHEMKRGPIEAIIRPAPEPDPDPIEDERPTPAGTESRGALRPTPPPSTATSATTADPAETSGAPAASESTEPAVPTAV